MAETAAPVIRAVDVDEMKRQIAWTMWWFHHSPAPVAPPPLSPKQQRGQAKRADPTRAPAAPGAERFDIGSYAVECMIEARAIAEAHLQHITAQGALAAEAEASTASTSTSSAEADDAPAPAAAPVPTAARRYDDYCARASLYEVVWRAVSVRGAATDTKEIRELVNATAHTLLSADHAAQLRKLYEKLDFAPRAALPFAQLPPVIVANLQRYYFASMFMSVALITAGDTFWDRTASRGLPLQHCTGYATYERMRTVYADTLAALRSSCEAVVSALAAQATRQKPGLVASASDSALAVAPLQLADALTDDDMRTLTALVAAETSADKHRIEKEKKRRGRNLLANLVSPRPAKGTAVAVTPGASSAAASKSAPAAAEPSAPLTTKPRRAQSVSIRPNVSRANLFAAISVRSETSPRSTSEGAAEAPARPVLRTRTDRPHAIEAPLDVRKPGHQRAQSVSGLPAPVTLDAPDFLAAADTFARHCWKLLEAGGVEQLALGAHPLIKEFAPPSADAPPALRTDLHVIMTRMSVELMRSPLIMAAFEALAQRAVSFENEVRCLLNTKYVGHAAPLQKASHQDLVRAHQLCVVIFAISGMTTRRTELQARLMHGGQNVEGNTQLGLYSACIAELTRLQQTFNNTFLEHARPRAQDASGAALYKTRPASVSLPMLDALRNNDLLDSASSSSS